MTLNSASSKGDLLLVESLVSQGAKVQAYDDWAVSLASMNGHLPVVEFLVSKGAKVQAKHNEALKMASRYGHLSVVEYLLSQGANPYVILLNAKAYPSKVVEFIQGIL